ncbi:MAG: hypothetical protein VX619_11730 [bacterium]|nr:hypothetical protein [bacterium]
MWFSLLLWLLFASPIWTTESSSRGYTLFHKTYIDGKRQTSCAECHNIQEKHYFSVKKSGPPLRNSFFRKYFKRSKFDNLKDAVADCMTSYQLRNNDKDFRDIAAYLKTVSHPQNHEPYQYGVLSDYLPLKLDGNDFYGKDTYEHSCLPCHSRLKITLLENPLSREGIYRKVRGMSRPRLVAQQNMKLVEIEEVPQQNMPNGFERQRFPSMPIFSEDRLSDSELLNIANYLVKRQEKSW